jgi:hypothetical protein
VSAAYIMNKLGTNLLTEKRAQNLFVKFKECLQKS